MKGLLLSLLLLAGCGGGRSSSSSGSATSVGKGRGTATLRISWPARSAARLVPSAANSVVVALSQGGTAVASRTVARPTNGAATTSTVFAGLAYGAYDVSVRAYPGTNGDGVAQATGSGAMTLTEDIPGTVAVALGSTVASLAISPNSPVADPGGTFVLTPSATDASGAIVPLAAGGGFEPIAWTSDSTAATLVSAGASATFRAGAAGGTASVTASLRIDDAGNVKTATVPVHVATSLDIAPSDARTLRDGPYGPILQSGLKDGGESDIGPFGAPVYRAYRWQALFPLSGIPAGATIRSATVTTSIVSTSSYTHLCAAYASASGTLTAATPTGTTSLGTVDNTVGAKTIDATAAIRAYVAAGMPYTGLIVSVPPKTLGIATWSAPTLTVAYTVP